MTNENKSPQDTCINKDDTITLPLLPLRNIFVFPSTIIPLFVGREKSVKALEDAMKKNKQIILCSQKDPRLTDPEAKDIHNFGVIANILQILKLPDKTIKVLIEGQNRALIKNFKETDRFYLVEAKVLDEQRKINEESEALLRALKSSFENYVRLNKKIPPEIIVSIAQITDPAKLCDTIVIQLPNLRTEDKQNLLEELDVNKRIEKVYQLILSESEVIRTEKKIRARVKQQMEKTQKEYYLHEQMTAIQKELGSKDDISEIQEFENKIKSQNMPKEVSTKVEKEIKKLKSSSPMSAEAGVIRNYVETVISLPWQKFTKDNTSLEHAEKTLEKDHFGLTKIKERILEYLSVKHIIDEIRGPILCLVGPPGVGKTSLAKSIAKCLNRKFVKISLGGVKDQSEIRGHRKTYIGSMPGKIMHALKKADSSNPVILLDEIDKVGMDHRGDPTAALLEVLDPEQNTKFNDHYLDIDYDLSKCLFIATANNSDIISKPLLDRTELVRISGYTENEKFEISKRYLIPKQLKLNGFTNKNIKIEDKAITDIIRHYTREAGVRNLEKEIASIFRKIARQRLLKYKTKNKKQKNDSKEVFQKKLLSFTETITQKSIELYLGSHYFFNHNKNKKSQIGICTGLAWTPYGGDLLSTEVVILPGQGKLLTTGKLGDTMQESAQAAMSYVRSRAGFLGLEKDFYQKIDIHIHVPEGAIPKDGPSAGLCMATALISALTKRSVNRDVAMTGEITLTGRALPIGGLKEKTLAAHRGGIKKVLFPKENIKDLEDIPESIKKSIKIIAVSHMDEVLLHTLIWKNITNKKTKDELYHKLMKKSDSNSIFLQ